MTMIISRTSANLCACFGDMAGAQGLKVSLEFTAFAVVALGRRGGCDECARSIHPRLRAFWSEFAVL